MSSQENDLILSVKELLIPLLAKRDMELFDIEFRGQGRKGILRVFIDKHEGITIDDCAEISRDLGTLLDIHDIIPGSYTLEVSSPGLTRPLRKPADFVRFKGRKVKIKTSSDIEKKKVFVGNILDFKDDLVTIETDGAQYLIPYGEIEKANLELDF